MSSARTPHKLRTDTRPSLCPRVAELPDKVVMIKKPPNEYLGGYFDAEDPADPMEIKALCCFETEEWAIVTRDAVLMSGGKAVTLGIQQAIDAAKHKADVGVIALAFFHDGDQLPYKFFFTRGKEQ